MAFVIKQSPTFWWPVRVTYPTDYGKYKTETFDGEFKRLSQPDVQKLAEKVESGETTAEELVKELLVDWKGISDGEDEVEFSEYTLNQLLSIPLVASAILNAFLESYTGGQNRRKN